MAATFGMPTVCFRGGCLTGPAHAGTELHGFLSYLMICTVTGRPYRVFGYKGKQVRDNIHSFDLVEAFAAFIRAPRAAEVYNIGGSRHSIARCWKRSRCAKKSAAEKLTWSYEEDESHRRSHLVDQRRAEVSANIIRNGNFATGCAKFSRKFTKPCSLPKKWPNESISTARPRPLSSAPRGPRYPRRVS